MKINKQLYFKNLTGYKISKSHFELGSNLHIDDYFYAKRIFYNSFYTNRLSFIIVRFILNDYNELIKKAIADNTKISLLSHEIYSELLLSNIRKMLNDYIQNNYSVNNEIFNHDIFTKDNLFIKNGEKLSEDIIFISPISTTFSTSIKIQNEITELYKNDKDKKEFKFHDLFYNCILIRNRGDQKQIVFSEANIEKDFGWIKADFDKRYIEMKNLDYNDIKNIKQFFLIDLESKWEKINECPACFPIQKEKEKCLIETKNSPVTPNVIFNFPKTNIYDDENSNSIYKYLKIYDQKDKIVCRKHFKIHNNHFIYYIKAGAFLKQNKPLVIDWLQKLKTNTKSIFNDKNIVLITPSLTSNSGFVNLVNENIFSDTATIIQYNPKEEYLFNFKFFYAKILEVADYILYVDDVLFSTNIFSEINFFIQNIKRKNKEYGDIDGCISLINRTAYFNFTKLNKKFLKNDKPIFENFININVAPILHKNSYPFDSLSKKFEELSQSAGLDEMRLHFKNKKTLFDPIDLTKKYDNLEKYSNPKDLFQFLIINEFHKIFQYDKESNAYLNEELIKIIIDEEREDSYKDLTQFISKSTDIQLFIEDSPIFKYDVKYSIYKICSKEPLIQFKDIKNIAFGWVLRDLIAMVKEINNCDEIDNSFFHAKKEDQPTNFSKYQEFRFLIKRGTKLKINFIYSIEALKAIKKVLKGINTFKEIIYYKTTVIKNEYYSKKVVKLFDEKKNRDIIKIEEDRKEPIFASEFITYYVGLLQELIVDHESKALQTVINVKYIIDKFESKNLKNTYNSDFMNLLRLMVYENTFIFQTSSDKFLKKYNNVVFNDLIRNKSTEYQNSNLVNFKTEIANYSKIYSFENTAKMLSRFNTNNQEIKYEPDVPMFDSFSEMLTLKSVLKNDVESNIENLEVPVNEKINLLLEYCAKIMNIKKGGAFFALKYKNKKNTNTDENDFDIVSEHLADNSLSPEDGFMNYDFKNSILKLVFNDIKRDENNLPLSTFEVSREKLEETKIHFIKNNLISSELIS